MAGSTLKRKEDITDLIRNILDQAAKTRRGFTPDVVREFEVAGTAAQQRRQEQAHREIREATPSRQIGGIVASRRREEAEQERANISPFMKQRGIEEAVDLGERLELASSGRPLTIREWVERKGAGSASG